MAGWWLQRALVPALLAVVATGCERQTAAPDEAKAPIAATPSADPRREMQGRWTIDPDRLAEQPALAAMSPEQRTLALEMSANLLASMTVRFGEADYAITTAGKTVEGRYTITAQDGAELVLSLVEDRGDGEPGAPEEVRLRVDSRGLVMTAGDDVLPLRRRADAEETGAAEATPPEAPAKEPLKIAAPPEGE